MNRVIWIYWETLEGEVEPPHITLCRETIKRNSGAGVRVVNSDNVRDYLPDIHGNIDLIYQNKEPDKHCIPIKTAFIRVFLLERYGGLYIDSDAIVLRSLDEVFSAIEERGFACTRKTSRPRHHIPNNFLGSLPNGRIIAMYANHMRYELHRRTGYDWGEVGSRALTPLVNGNLDSAAVFAERRIHPVINNDQDKFAEASLTPKDVLSRDALVCMLFHGVFDESHHRQKGLLARHGTRDLYYGDNLLGRVFRNALPPSVLDEIPIVETRPAASDQSKDGTSRWGRIRRRLGLSKP